MILMDMASGTIIEEVQNIIDELALFTKTRYVMIILKFLKV